MLTIDDMILISKQRQLRSDSVKMHLGILIDRGLLAKAQIKTLKGKRMAYYKPEYEKKFYYLINQKDKYDEDE